MVLFYSRAQIDPVTLIVLTHEAWGVAVIFWEITCVTYVYKGDSVTFVFIKEVKRKINHANCCKNERVRDVIIPSELLPRQI